MGRTEYESSAIASASYDQAKQELEIEFRNGGTYRYLGVPPEEAEAFASASSKGGFFQQFIRNNYTASKVVPDQDVESFPFPEPSADRDLEHLASAAPQPGSQLRVVDKLDIRQIATIFRDIFTKNIPGVSDEGRLNMAISQLRALGVGESAFEKKSPWRAGS